MATGRETRSSSTLQVMVMGVPLPNENVNTRESREARKALTIGAPLTTYRKDQLTPYENAGRLVPPPEVQPGFRLERKPAWIGCTNDSRYAGRVLRHYFPGLLSPEEAERTFYGTPLPVLLCNIWDLEGLIGREEPLDNFLLTSALKYFFRHYEAYVWIPDQPVMHSRLSKIRDEQRGLAIQAEGAAGIEGKRFWVLPTHVKRGDHWAVAVFDRRNLVLSWMDSGRGDRFSELLGEVRFLKQWVQIKCGRAVGCQNISRTMPMDARQSGDWECGVWVIEHVRWFFRNLQFLESEQPSLRGTAASWGEEAIWQGVSEASMPGRWREECQAVFDQTPRGGLREASFYDPATRMETVTYAKSKRLRFR
ncbi:hypothetical protein QBC44DRAFT_392887 [Cladorrhinum sp. PSN332]|nr:hypothetical protein QBC44DRAFT_392887 [Cladorrhinum sp. PSN332]